MDSKSINEIDRLQRGKTSCKSGNRYSIDMILGRLMKESNTSQTDQHHTTENSTDLTGTNITEIDVVETVVDNNAENIEEKERQVQHDKEHKLRVNEGRFAFIMSFDYFVIIINKNR